MTDEYLLFRFECQIGGFLSLFFIRMLAVVFYLIQIFPEVNVYLKLFSVPVLKILFKEQLKCN